MYNSIFSVGFFLVSTVFGLLTFVGWARMFIAYFSIGAFHPLSQSIYKMTAPIVLPIQRILLKKNGSRSRIDWACFIALVLLGLLKWSIMSALFFHQALSVVGIVLSTFLDLIIEPCNLLFYALIIRMVMSWLNPAWRDSFASLIVSITEPMLRPLRGILPNTGLFDFSPLVALIVIKALTLFVSGFLPIPLI